MNLLDNIKQKALEENLLIRKTDEEKYGKKNGISVRRLSNGARILSVQRIVGDSRVSTVSFNMHSGGYLDPKGYEGAHHFLEHLFFTQKLRNLYQKYLIESNAFTSQDKISFYTRGGFNTKVKDFGLQKVLKATVDSIIYPETLDNTESFEFSKEIILREIDEFYADYRRYMFDELYKLTLVEDNPFYGSALGYRESVIRITPEIVKKVLNGHISTQNMIATIFSEGNGAESHELSNVVADLLEKFPRTQKVDEIKWENIAKTKKLPFGKTVRHSVKIQSNIVSINYAWMIPIEYLSKDDRITRLLGPFLSELFNIEGREKGLGYSLYFYPRYFFPKSMLITASVLCPVEELDKTQTRMEQVVTTTLRRPLVDKQLFEELLSTEKNRQSIEPIYSGGRMDTAYDSVKWFDLLFNSERMRELFLELKENDLLTMLKKITDQKPAIYILGNI